VVAGAEATEDGVEAAEEGAEEGAEDEEAEAGAFRTTTVAVEEEMAEARWA